MQDIITVKPETIKELIPEREKYAVFGNNDIRGIYPEELDAEIAYKAAKAFMRISPGKKYVVAYDMRKSSTVLAEAVMQAFIEEDLQIDSLGETTTDHLYFTVGQKKYDGGIMITASHNSSQFNGLKMVKKDVVPIKMTELTAVFKEIENELHYLPLSEIKPTNIIDTSDEFIEHVANFAEGSDMKPMKIVVDAGNGMAGKLVTKLCQQYDNIDLVPMYFEPNSNFPHHEANPAERTNLRALQERVIAEKADLGAAFDGDGDRVFFVDHKGKAIEGYYTLSLLTEYFLHKHKGAAVIYDLRNVRGIESVIRVTGGRGIPCKAGHSFIKRKMKQEDAVFGGESASSHFYYRENHYADSGIITLQIVLKLISDTKSDLADLVKTYQERFFSSGEKNFYVKHRNPKKFEEVANRLKNEFPSGAFSDYDGLVIDFPKWRFNLRPSTTQPFWRLNIEADSKALLEEKQAALFNILAEYGEHTGLVSNMYGVQTMNLDKKEKLEYLFKNLHFTWNHYKGDYLDDLYKTDWSRNHTPLDVLRAIDNPVLDEFYEKNKYNIEESVRLEQTYLRNETWFDDIAKKDKLLSKLFNNPIAYFSLEFGFVDWLQIYSGGLGVLAADTMKEASDSGLPMVGIGLFYSQGYFYQRFTEDGWQIEDYLHQDTDDYPMETVKDENGYTIVVDVKVGQEIVKVRAWRVKIGRRSLLLLDTNFDENEKMEDKMITYHLYGGDQDTRIKQEIVLAFGGYKILQALGIHPSILHLNEGHSAFAVIAQAQDIMSSEGLSCNEALEKSKQNILFTNHTLKQAGNDIFPYQLVEKYLGVYAADMGVDFREIFSLGVDSIYAQGKFGMTILGMKNSNRTNAVSIIHAEAAKKVWPDHEMIPVTNGVHLSTWVSASIHELLDEYIGERWNEQSSNVNFGNMTKVPDDRLWQAHMSAKKLLLKHISFNCKVNIPEDALILSWFRRFTSYKRPEVLIMDLERLAGIVNNSERPVRFIFGGKAHPKDTAGKSLLRDMYNLVHNDDRFRDKIILVPDYNWRMARYMISGSDVWVNSPIRYQEACGTSGMKAGANGVLQFSTIDGWIDEVKDRGIVWEIADNLNAGQYFDQLEQQIIPLFWDRNDKGLPYNWIQRMKETMKIVLANYGTDRMLREYIEKLFRPILKDNQG